MINMFGWVCFAAFFVLLFFDNRDEPDFILCLVFAVLCLSVEF